MEFCSLGMIIPLSPYLARDFGANDLEVGLLMSVYSLAQLIFAPFWGQLSDKWGRRPVILIGTGGTALFHLWFSFAESLQVLFFTRILAGVFGALMSIAMASIADVTEQKERSKNMGLVGAGIGLGFVIGPFLGAGFGALGNHLGSLPPFGNSFAAFGAFLVSLLNGLIAFFFFKETYPQKSSDVKNIFWKIKDIHRLRIQQIFLAFKNPVLKQVLIMYFLLTLALAGIESSLFLYVRDEFGWSHFPASLGFTYIGFILLFTQGFLVRKWIPIFGENILLKYGLISAVIGFAGTGLSSTSWGSLLLLLAFSVTLFSVGYSLSSTCLSGALSLLTTKDQQGGVFGVQHSLFSLARIIGPALGGWFYKDISHSAPFYLSSLLTTAILIVALKLKGGFPERGKT